ncbi:uncharacterized protein LOC108193953 isoform X2 [Daucus carota subsp. sativus]|uniref:uncharacterized protein LOC108193953 isoform X2 n=1 Tax=Daucus carota subsp. sativus TaxID=79200 RepID=UPI0007EFB37C|nr:PREDICTED: major antigen isoform X2 [Daucus carota subsp. sativus]
MSSDSDSSRNSFDIDDLSQIQARCRELRKEKDSLNASQSQSFQLIKRLEIHVKTLLGARAEDKKRIQELERELSNCSQELDYLQDQLNSRNTEVQSLGDRVHTLELKLADVENLELMGRQMTEELEKSNSDVLFLNQELENKEIELQQSNLRIESLEESILSVSLDYQCEIESMKFELMTFEQSCFEASKIQEEAAQENGRLDQLNQDLEVQIQDCREVIKCLSEENKELREKLIISESKATEICMTIEEKFPDMLNKDGHPLPSELKNDARWDVGRVSFSDLEDKFEKMSSSIIKYEARVRQLKEELREQKFKANEEAEDLAQEMAELRYQMNGLLEEECKRRAHVEQISIQRIAELEAQKWNGRYLIIVADYR